MAGFFSNVNLCGASEIIGDALTKLNSSKVAIKASIPASAATTVAIVEGDKNALTAALQKVQTASDWINPDAEEIIDVVGEDRSATSVNLQAEVAAINQQQQGSSEHISAIERVVTEFADDVAAAGSEILDVISKAYALFTKGFDPCSIIPNLQKIAGSTSAAQLKPSNIKAADADPIPEKKSGSSFTEALNKILLGDLSELSTEEAAKRGIEYGTPENIDSAGIFGTSADNTDNKFNFNSNANTAIINGKPVQKNPAGNWINPDGFTVNQKTGDIKKN